MDSKYAAAAVEEAVAKKRTPNPPDYIGPYGEYREAALEKQQAQAKADQAIHKEVTDEHHKQLKQSWVDRDEFLMNRAKRKTKDKSCMMETELTLHLRNCQPSLLGRRKQRSYCCPKRRRMSSCKIQTGTKNSTLRVWINSPCPCLGH